MRAFIIAIIGFLALTPISFGSVSVKDDGCLKCHRLRGLFSVSEGNKVKDCSINDVLYAHSVHRNVGCTECHDKIEAYPHDSKNVQANCANKCHVVDPSTGKPFSHKGIVDTWRDSVHGKNYDKAPDIYPSCSYCHTNALLLDVSKFESLEAGLGRCSVCHKDKDWATDRLSHVSSRMDIPDRRNGFSSGFIKTRRDGWEVVELCAGCHENKEKMDKAIEIEGIKNIYKKDKIIHAVESYKVTMHSKMLYLERSDTRAADCLDCHTNKGGNFHDIFREDDSRSSINVNNIERTCGRSSECHPLAEAKKMRKFATTKWVHMRPIPENLGQWIVWLVQGVFIALVTFVLLFATGFVMLDLIKNLRGK